MFIYLVMAFWAGLGLAFNFRLSGMMAQALAPTGALFAFLSLWTGALWGNFPQTYSMAGVILSAMRLSQSWEERYWRASS